jgi:lysophospholipase L1-like esterase
VSAFKVWSSVGPDDGRRLIVAIAAFTVFLTNGWAGAAEDVTILPLGDSITAGNGYGGYRARMAADLTAAGFTFHLVGSQTMSNGGETAPSLRPPHDGLRHEGHGGWRIDQLDANLNGNTNVDAGGRGGYFITGGHGTGRAAIKPDVICVLAGINDINQNYGQKEAAGKQMSSTELLPILQARMTSLVDNLHSLTPDSHILLSNVIPYANGLLKDTVTGATMSQRKAWAQLDGVSPEQELGVNHYVIHFNRWLKDEFVPKQKAEGVKITLVDQYQNFILADGKVRGWGTKPGDGYADFGLHPNQFGYDLMGATWAKAIQADSVPEPGSSTLCAIVAAAAWSRSNGQRPVR